MRSKHSGQSKALTKSKEMSVYQALQAAGIAFEYQKHLPFHGCDLDSETKCAFVDFAITAPWGALLLEVDEGQPRAIRAATSTCARPWLWAAATRWWSSLQPGQLPGGL